jgi:cytochrome bd ubiquinol oxidase subunit II
VAYPEAFESIASTLAVPLLIAAIGIILRGAAYALRAGTSRPREFHVIDAVTGASSVITPFALGTVVGAIAAGRVPVGNAAGSLFSSWLNPTSIMVGVLAVAVAAYLAAIFMAADAVRLKKLDLERWLRVRALGAGLVAGVFAAAGLIVISATSHQLFVRLFTGAALVSVIVSTASGIVTLGLVPTRRYELARYTAALSVAGVIAGWAFAQNPTILPGLTVQQAASSHDVLVAVIIAVLGGAVLLFPSLGLLFRLLLRGQFDAAAASTEVVQTARGLLSASWQRLLGRLAVAFLIAGLGFLTVADSGWAHAIGVAALLGFILAGFFAVVPQLLALPSQNQRK